MRFKNKLCKMRANLKYKLSKVAESAKMGLGLSWFMPMMVPKCHGLIPRSFHTIEYACLDGYRSPRLSNVKNGKHYNKWFSWYFTIVDPYHGGMKNIKTTMFFSKKKFQMYCFSLQCFSCGFNDTYFISNVNCKTKFRISSTFSSLFHSRRFKFQTFSIWS